MKREDVNRNRLPSARHSRNHHKTTIIEHDSLSIKPSPRCRCGDREREGGGGGRGGKREREIRKSEYCQSHQKYFSLPIFLLFKTKTFLIVLGKISYVTWYHLLIISYLLLPSSSFFYLLFH